MIDYTALAPLFHFRNHSSVLTDLNVTTIGFCDFNRYKDVCRTFRHPHHTLHFILEGEGTYTIEGKTFKLKKNQAFYTPPEHLISYYPSEHKPWTYLWFAFVGEKAEDYIQQFSIAKDYICSPSTHEELRKLVEKILKHPHTIYVREETIRSHFFKFVELLTQDESEKWEQVSIPTYIALAKDFMWANHANPHLTIQNVAQSIHISHSYLCAIFKAYEGISAKQCLSLQRLKQATSLLMDTELSVTEISMMCGYKDPLYFSAAFKKQFGYSPSAYREQRIYIDPYSTDTSLLKKESKD